MNREIKFRVYNKVTKLFDTTSCVLDIYNGKLIGVGKYNYKYANDILINDVNLFNNNDYLFQQFTGLKDKNGKEIYEGDIVKSSVVINSISPSRGIFLVRYNKFLCDYELDWLGKHFYELQTAKQKRNFNKKYQDFDTDFAKLTGAKSEKLEIIGNIFKNSDLLK